MSIIIIPQVSSKYNSSSWHPQIIDKPHFIDGLCKLVKRKTMDMKYCTFFAKDEFTCQKFTSNTGTTDNIVYQKVKGPIVYYKDGGFSNDEADYMINMLLKVKGKQISRSM